MKKLGILLAVIVSAEICVRLLIPSAMLFGTWYTDGAYTPDLRYGFVPTPNFHGLMSHPENVYEVPMVLDRLGFRPAIGSGQPSGKTVLVLGGASMTFGYGVPSDKTFSAYLSKLLPFSNTVYNTAFPGLDVFRNLNLIQEKLGINPDILILNLYFSDRLPASWDRRRGDYGLHKAPSYESLFRVSKGRITIPVGVVANALGKYNYKSALLNRAVRIVDEKLPSALLHPVAKAIGLLVPPPYQDPDQNDKASVSETQGLENFSDFVLYLKQIWPQTKVFLTFLPVQALLGVDAYQQIRVAVPNGVKAIDLHQLLKDEIGKPEYLNAWLGGGHYSRSTNYWIAKSIARVIAPSALASFEIAKRRVDASIRVKEGVHRQPAD